MVNKFQPIKRGAEAIIPYHKPMKLNVDFTDIFESGIYTNAEYCRKLEKKLGEMYHCEALVCSSGTAGLIIAINFFCLDHTVSLPVFNWSSDDYAIKLLDKNPVYFDVNKYYWFGYYDQKLDIRLHTFGNIDNSQQENCIYDGTHILGAKPLTLGRATIISFAPTKLVTAGEGGVLLRDKIEKEIIEFRDRCFRMSEFHAKICLEYLNYLNEFLEWKRMLFTIYESNINGTFQQIPYNSNYNTIGFLNINNLTIPKEIETKQYYQPLEHGYRNADYIYKNIICLPSYMGVDYRKIVELIEDANK